MANLTLTQLMQLYAPLVGLLGLAFWSGVLTQRVAGHNDAIAAHKEEIEKIQTLLAIPDLNGERLVRVETKLEGMKDSLDALERGMQGVQRQIANTMQSSK